MELTSVELRGPSLMGPTIAVGTMTLMMKCQEIYSPERHVIKFSTLRKMLTFTMDISIIKGL